MKLTGDQVVLRDLTLDDLVDVHNLVGDPRVTDWLSFDARSLQQSEAMIEGIISRRSAEPRSEWYLGITGKADDRVVGFVRLAREGVDAAQLGYALIPEVQGRGYAADAIRTIITAGLQQWNLHRVAALIGPDNARSIQLVKRLGFTYEGTIRDHVYTNGAWRDSQMWSVLDHEWNGTETG